MTLGRTAGVAGLVVVAGLLAFCLVAPAWVDADRNGVHPGRRRPVSDRARALHGRLLVVDLHADPLLWGRDLLARSRRGHVDLPRLEEGNVALQVFSVVTKVPRRLNIHRNDDATDDVRLLALAQGWPPRTWTSLRERALYQAGRLRAAAEASSGRLVVVRSGRELDEVLARRGGGSSPVAAVLALEGAHALEGDLASLDVLRDAGYRMASLAHFFDTDLGGSAHGVGKGGLTALGRVVVGRMEERGIVLDLAHASPAVVSEALALTHEPVVVSHTGVRGTCDNARNLSDEQLRGVARTGGVVGIGYWETAVCGRDAAAVARAIRHAARVAGIDHVALGSDFDGAVATPFDASGLVGLTDALLDAGLGEDEIAKVMGGNALRVLRATLP